MVQYTLLSVPAALVLLLGLSMLGFFPWSGINCTHHDVDIQSGRVRLTRYVLWLPVHKSVDDSALTKALRTEDYDASTPAWHHAVTLSPGLRHSPHYAYHSAISQIRDLEVVWSLAEFTPSARRASARRILKLWQQTGGDEGAKPYLWELDRIALADGSNRNSIDEEDLPREPR